MTRNQACQLFNKCLLKGWIYDEAVLRRPKATDSFKFYTLTKSGETHAEIITSKND